MMKKWLVILLYVSFIFAEEIETRKTVKKAAAVQLKNGIEARADGLESETIIVETSTGGASSSTTAVLQVDPVTEKVVETTSKKEDIVISITTSSTDLSEINEDLETNEADDSSEFSNVHSTQNPKRKILYVNQQQNGKLNVHLELSDVSVIVIPNQKDPQLSLLNLLFKSAQKSNMQLEAKKKEDHLKLAENHHDEYSKYKQLVRNPDENFHFSSSMPFVESRAPYKVDISSTIGQKSQPAVDIIPHSQQQLDPSTVEQFQPQFARSPIMQLLKPTPLTVQVASSQEPHNNRISKRSIPSRVIGIDADTPNESGSFINSGEDELTESILNTLDNGDEYNELNTQEGFVLLGATENCGPGRKRNSYQICVAVDDMK